MPARLYVAGTLEPFRTVSLGTSVNKDKTRERAEHRTPGPQTPYLLLTERALGREHLTLRG